MASLKEFQIDHLLESVIQMSNWNLAYVYLKANIRFYHKFRFDLTDHLIDFYTEKGFDRNMKFLIITNC